MLRSYTNWLTAESTAGRPPTPCWPDPLGLEATWYREFLPELEGAPCESEGRRAPEHAPC